MLLAGLKVSKITLIFEAFNLIMLLQPDLDNLADLYAYDLSSYYVVTTII